MADTERFTFASQLAVLRNCPEVLSKLLRNKDSVLLAAKVLVISRLLHKKLSQISKPPPYLDSVRNRLANLRRKLLVKIDRRFQGIEITGDDLIQAMCAFSLATSTSPTDVLRHFHHVRLEAMIQPGQKRDDGVHGFSQALRLYIKTLKDTKMYIPGQLGNALQNLKGTPLFKSQDLHSLIELNLEMHEKWISDEIRLFTPYIRHDDLQRSDTNRVLKEWAEHASNSFLGELRTKIQSIDEFAVLMELRTHLLQLWLSNSQRSLGVEVSEVLDGLRNVFNARCTWLIKAHAMSLENVAVAIRDTISRWQSGQSDFCPSLWASSMASKELADGGKLFIRTVLDRYTGRNEALQTRSLEYLAWVQRVEKIEEMIGDMRKIRWEDAVDEIEADEDLLEDKQILLSEEDPRLLHDALANCLERSFSSFSDSIRTLTLELEEPNRGQQAAYLLRIWREIRQRLPKSFEQLDLGLEIITPLQEIVANAAIAPPLHTCEKRIEKSRTKVKTPERPLWEGSPELPVLPSSWTFRLLTELISSMTALGVDIWCPQATNVLKQQLKICLESLLRTSITPPQAIVNWGTTAETAKSREEGNPSVNDVVDEPQEEESTSHDLSEDAKIQLAFDLLYLSHATAEKHGKQDDNDLVQLMQRSIIIEGLAEESAKRIKKDAVDYWKRTCLLFALLA